MDRDIHRRSMDEVTFSRLSNHIYKPRSDGSYKNLLNLRDGLTLRRIAVIHNLREIEPITEVLQTSLYPLVEVTP